jgi:hypothetical protein
MSVDNIFDTTQFTIAAGATISLSLAFNGNTQSGGDYFGPIVADALATRVQQSLRVSTVRSMRVSRDSGGLTSHTIYLFRVTNQNSFHVTFNMEFLVND